MKTKSMVHSRAIRVICITVIAVLFALTTALSVSAANSITADSVEYDFTSYATTNDAVYKASNPSHGGWLVSGELPSGATGSLTVNVSEASAGGGDYVTRSGAGLFEDFTVTYIIPENDRTSIKDFGQITYTRYLKNGLSMAKYSTGYTITFVMDDGQSFDVSGVWNDETNVVSSTVVTKNIQNELEGISGNPELERIEYRPYAVNTNFFYDEAVSENSTIVYFLTKYMRFTKALDMPVLDVEEDTYDGETVFVHNGVISGLDPNMSYLYKGANDTIYTPVFGETEITGLVGGGYEVIAVSSDASVSNSAPRKVTVPKAKTVYINHTKDDFTNGVVMLEKSSSAVPGIWTYGGPGSLYIASGRITVSASYNEIVAAENDDFLKYSRSTAMFRYALRPEEQADVDNLIISVTPGINGSAVFGSNDDIVGALYLYTSENDEPFVIEGLTYASHTTPFRYNISNLFPEAKGVLTKIEIAPMYSVFSSASNPGKVTYFQFTDIKLSEREKAATPELVLAETEKAGQFRIVGLSESKSYEISTDGVNYTSLPKKIHAVDNITYGKYYIRVMESKGNLASDAVYFNVKDRPAAPSGIVGGNGTITGFDSTVIYEYAPYDINGENQTFTDIYNTTALAGVAGGLYEVRIKATTDDLASYPVYAFVEGSANKGKVTPLAQTDPEVRGFITGQISSDVRRASLYTAMNKPNIFVMYEGWTKTTDMAVNEELNFVYAFEPDQVFDIKELDTFKYNTSISGSGFYLNNGNKAGFYNKIRFYVVNSDVEYYDVYTQWNYATITTVNIATLLPAEAHGYVVGYKFYFYGKYPEISSTMKSGFPYPVFHTYDIGLTGAVDTPVYTKTIAGDNCTVSGLSSSLYHAYSTDGENYTDVPMGITAFTVANSGTLYFYAYDSTGHKSDLVKIVLTEDEPEEVETFEPKELHLTGFNTISGFDSAKSYEMRKVNVLAENAFTAVEAGTEVLGNMASGLWEFRYAGGTDTAFVLVPGADVGSIAFKGILSTDVYNPAENIAGKWYSSVARLYYDSVAGGNEKIRLATTWSSSVEQSEREKLFYYYTFTDDEIVSASEMNSIGFKFAFGLSNPYSRSNNITAKVRYYVKGAKVDYYDVNLVYTIGGEFAYADFTASNPNAEGYITGIKVWPLYAVPADTTLISAENKYPTMKIATIDNGSEYDVYDRYRVLYNESYADENATALNLKPTSNFTVNRDTGFVYITAEGMKASDVKSNFKNATKILDNIGNEIVDMNSVIGTGATVVYENGDVTDILTVVLIGDVNGNGRIDTNDYLFTRNLYQGKLTLDKSGAAFAACDVNKSGRADTGDYLQIKRHYCGQANLFE